MALQSQVRLARETAPGSPGGFRGDSGGSGIPLRHVPAFVGAPDTYNFAIEGGTVWIDHPSCDEKISDFIIEQSSGLLKANENGKPVLAVSPEEIAKKDSELIALEIECRREGHSVVFVDLRIEGLD